jgi:hypothetical protein
MARTLGLNVQFGKAQKELAAELGKTTDELTEEEIMLARTNAVMKAGVRIAGTYEAAMDTAGKKILSMDRQLEELSRVFGELFLPALNDTVTGVYALASGINAVLQAQEDHNKEMLLGEHTYEEYRVEMIRLGASFDRRTGELTSLTEAQWKLARAVETGKTTMDGWNTKLLTAAQTIELFPELEVTANTEPAEQELETFAEWLTRWSRENKRKVQLQAVLRVSEELATAITEEGSRGGEFRAMGGPVQAGRPYIVGEESAELFVPGESGHVYNQNQLAGGDINISNGLSQRAFNNMAEDFFRGIGG